MKLYRRENYLSKIRGFYNDTGIIKVISGVRRCGKSSLMHTIAEELAESGVPQENIIFLDLRKRGFRNIKTPEDASGTVASKLTPMLSMTLTVMFASLLTVTVAGVADKPWYWIVIDVLTKIAPLIMQVPAAYDYCNMYMEGHLITNLLNRRSIALSYLADIQKGV
jgi:AAA+ ATPase superfamily predicted ATPase